MLAQEMTVSFIDKNVDKRAKCPWAIMNALVRCRHESLKKTGLDEPIGTHGDKRKNRWGKPRTGSSLTFGTNNMSTKMAPRIET